MYSADKHIDFNVAGSKVYLWAMHPSVIGDLFLHNISQTFDLSALGMQRLVIMQIASMLQLIIFLINLRLRAMAKSLGYQCKEFIGTAGEQKLAAERTITQFSSALMLRQYSLQKYAQPLVYALYVHQPPVHDPPSKFCNKLHAGLHRLKINSKLAKIAHKRLMF